MLQHDFRFRIQVTVLLLYFFFFFQAEDGIRDLTVTGVQTCALPISCTVIAAAPLFPSLVAVIVVAPPSATSVTSPAWDTVATVGALDAQVTLRPVNRFAAESLSVTANCTVPPTGSVAVVGLTTTEATGTSVTVTVAVALFPSLVAVMVAEPAALPVTRPLVFTLATLALLLAHVTVRPVSVPPAESLVVALSCNVCPTRIPAVAGETCTEATGTSLTVIVAVALLPSLVAAIVAEPAATPLTEPFASIVATLVALDDHATVRPVSALPAESIGVEIGRASCRER